MDSIIQFDAHKIYFDWNNITENLMATTLPMEMQCSNHTETIYLTALYMTGILNNQDSFSEANLGLLQHPRWSAL